MAVQANEQYNIIVGHWLGLLGDAGLLLWLLSGDAGFVSSLRS
jgi:hypothetical protein